MKKYLNVVERSPLFQGLSREEMERILGCLGARTMGYKKGAAILRAGDTTSAIGMVLAGSAHVQEEDFWGNRTIVAEILPAELFAETYACTPGTPLGVGVVAQEPTEVLFLNVQQVLTTCPSACTFHTQLVRNLVAVLAKKNLYLSGKLSHMARRTTRDKLLSYLSGEAGRQGTAAFEIPFNRQELADYLCVDRSAMSNELCKLRDEGVLEFQKNRFRLSSTVE